MKKRYRIANIRKVMQAVMKSRKIINNDQASINVAVSTLADEYISINLEHNLEWLVWDSIKNMTETVSLEIADKKVKADVINSKMRKVKNEFFELYYRSGWRSARDHDYTHNFIILLNLPWELDELIKSINEVMFFINCCRESDILREQFEKHDNPVWITGAVNELRAEEHWSWVAALESLAD